MTNEPQTMDGNEAAAHVAYALNEVIAIFPITPSSTMGEWADTWSAQNRPNVWGTVPHVVEMQSEAGAAATVHGALQAGSLATTFTASQGLLLMIPNMYKIAGELTPAVFHVAARALATHALSIFGDHSDVMACRQTGFAMLASGSVQEAMDFALIAHSATLESRVPFIHFFDGFRTSHELQKIQCLSADEMRQFIDPAWVLRHRHSALTPDRPIIRGTAQNPDVFFQSREAISPYYAKLPSVVEATFERFSQRFGRQYRLFEYFGSAEPDRVIILMGSGTQTAEQTVEYMNESLGESVGLIKVRLFRPFCVERFINALPKSVIAVAVLDRTKEPGSVGEPLCQDVQSALYEDMQSRSSNRKPVRICGGRYGLASKEFTPAMIKGIFDELKKDAPKKHFTIGIKDDVSHSSLDYPTQWNGGEKSELSCIFYGLGSDGTVSSAKNTLKILAHETEYHVQAYFVYDSKKAGSVTESHLRISKHPIKAAYLVDSADFIGCHQFSFLEKLAVLKRAKPGATLLINSPFEREALWEHLPLTVQNTIIEKRLRVFAVDAYKIARNNGLRQRVNTIMQTCFFAISQLLDKQIACEQIKRSVIATFGKAGEDIIQKNIRAVDEALSCLYALDTASKSSAAALPTLAEMEQVPHPYRLALQQMMGAEGDTLPVSALPVDGTYPVATTRWEKRRVAQEIPVWDPAVCIQCGKCAIVCPHAAIRIKAYEPSHLTGAPTGFKQTAYLGKDLEGRSVYTIQVSPDDCTGCELCVVVCPARNKSSAGLKALNMAPVGPLRAEQNQCWNFFEKIPYVATQELKGLTVKSSQFLQPLFEFSGACAGCGETPYIKLVTQLFGDRILVANATGCSSIYGGNLPTTPWCMNTEGRGPSWSNSLFEDNAEFGAGFRLAIDVKVAQAKSLLSELGSIVDRPSQDAILLSRQDTEQAIIEQRARVQTLKDKLGLVHSEKAQQLLSLSDYLVRKSVWIIGGDGWAYDIGFGGLDHVLASQLNVNILVLDTEVYSNTGGQMSKATPIGAVAKFASGGKASPKKNLALYAIGYGHVYVAQIAMGANDAQALTAIREADAYDGPSLIVAYSPCVAHGYDMRHSLRQSKLAVESGHWPLLRFNPTAHLNGEKALTLDSREPKVALKDYIYQESRYKILDRMDSERAEELLKLAEREIHRKWSWLKTLSEMAPKKME